MVRVDARNKAANKAQDSSGIKELAKFGRKASKLTPAAQRAALRASLIALGLDPDMVATD